MSAETFFLTFLSILLSHSIIVLQLEKTVDNTKFFVAKASGTAQK